MLPEKIDRQEIPQLLWNLKACYRVYEPATGPNAETYDTIPQVSAMFL